jgi:Uma2 family endonuclease
MATTTSKIVTYEEWLNMPESEGKEEVVDGEIITMPPAKWKHALTVQNLQMTLLKQLDPRIALVVTAIFGLVIRKEPLTCREPDLAVFVKQNIVERDGYIYSPPELVVEVLSPANTRKYMARKIADYESIGVPELWILSREGRTFEVLQLQNGKLQRIGVFAEGQLRPLRFPDAVVDVASIWPD